MKLIAGEHGNTGGEFYMHTTNQKNAFTCRICGNTFVVPTAALNKYPGWTPSVCLSCRNRSAPPEKLPQQSDLRITQSEPRPLVSPAVSVTSSSLTPDDPPGLKQILEEILQQNTMGPFDGIFTDGACSGNPGPGGWGAVYVKKDQIIAQAYGHELLTTNNRMELTGLIAGFEMIDSEKPLTVWSDSQLCVNTINLWVRQWERNGWRRKGGPIKNLELVQRLYALTQKHPQAKLCWIKAHNGTRWNEYVDALSTAHLHA